MEVAVGYLGVEKEIEALTNGSTALRVFCCAAAAKCKIAEHAKIQNPEMPMYQLIHSEGEIQIEEQAIVENGNRHYGNTDGSYVYLCGQRIEIYFIPREMYCRFST